MSTVTDHGLICPDANDYGALALLMQADALATDASLAAIEASFDSVNTLPYAIFTTTSGNSFASNSEQQQPQGSWATVSMRGFTLVSAGGALTGSVATLQTTVTGRYEYGNYLNLTLVGAATAFSRREIYASVYQSVSGSAPVRLDEARWRTVENSVTGGEFLICSGGSFYATAGTTIILVARWSHANLASNVASQAGALFWINYASSDIEIGSA